MAADVGFQWVERTENEQLNSDYSFKSFAYENQSRDHIITRRRVQGQRKFFFKMGKISVFICGGEVSGEKLFKQEGKINAAEIGVSRDAALRTGWH